MSVKWNFTPEGFGIGENDSARHLRIAPRHYPVYQLKGGPWWLERMGPLFIRHFCSDVKCHEITITGTAGELRVLCIDLLANLMED